VAISVVQSKSGTGTTLSFTSATTAGNCIVVGYTDEIGAETPTGVTLGGAAGNFAQLVAAAATPVEFNGVVALWADPSCAGGQTAISVTVSGSNAPAVWAIEVSGLVPSSPLDKETSSSGSSGSWSSGSTATTSQATELWVGACCDIGVGNAPPITGPSSPWVNTTVTNASADPQIFGYQIASSTGTAVYSGTIGPADGWIAAVATLKGAVAAPADIPQIRPGPSWFDQFKPGLPRPKPPVPPSGPYYGNLPNPADIPVIVPGTTWLDQFKPGLRKPRPQVPSYPTPIFIALGVAAVTIASPAPTVNAGVGLGVATVTISVPQISVGESFPLSPATVTISALTPTVSGVGVAVSTATVTISTPAPVPNVSVPLSAATVTIGTPAPAVTPGVGLGLATVTIAVPAVMPIVTQPDIPHLMPGPAWLRHFKAGLRKALPFNAQRITPNNVHLGVCAVTIAVPAIKPVYAPVVDLSPATVIVRVYPILPSRKLLVSIASSAGVDDYGNAFPQGILATSGVIEGPTFIGPNYIINTAGAFFYSDTPALNNLIASISVNQGTDLFGNTYYQGVCSYIPSGSGGIPSQVSAVEGGAIAIGTNDNFTTSFPMQIISATSGIGTFSSSTTSFGDEQSALVFESANYSGIPGGSINVDAGFVAINADQVNLTNSGATIPYPSPNVTTEDGFAIVEALQAVGIFD
jgi:hypothetical protein